MEKTVAQATAKLAADLKFEDLPEEVVEKVKMLTLDVLGSMIGTRNIKSSQIARKVASELGGPEESSIVGEPKKVSEAMAAFANAIQCYGLDFVDDHNESNAHPSPATFPVGLALSENMKKSGKDFIQAVALGNEVVCRMGSAYLGDMYYQGFHPTSTCGAIAAAVCAAKLYGLSEEQITNAIGIAGSTVSGLMAWNSTGSLTKRYQAGNPAKNGIVSARMAKYGYDGPYDIFESADGVFHAYSYKDHYDPKVFHNGLGKEWMFVDSSIKVYPCCRYSGGHLDACLEIVNKYHPNPQEIQKIDIESSKYTMHLLAEKKKWDPKNIVDLQFSMPYQAAIAFKNGKVTVDEFDEKYINDPLIKRLISSTTVRMNDEFERRYPEHYSSAVTITMKDGTTYRAVIDDPKGDKRNPVHYEDVVKKFRYLANRTYSDPQRAEKIISYVNELDKQTDMSELMHLVNDAAK